MSSPSSPPGSLLGVARPRVELRPEAAQSFGDSAVELAAAAGIVLEPWQVDGLQVMLGVRDDGLWAAREYVELLGRQQGKTAGLGVPRVLAGLLILGEQLISWSAHEVATALEAHRSLRAAFATLGEEVGQNEFRIGPMTVRAVDARGSEGYNCSTGQRIRITARSKGASRGFSGDVTILDEAWAYTRAQQSAMAPTMVARPNPQTVILSSPPLDADSGEVLFALRARAAAGEPDLAFRDWGLGMTLDEFAALDPLAQRAFVADRARWAAALPALGRGRVTERAVEQLRREMTPVDFARELLGMWPVQGDGTSRVIPAAAWEPLQDPGSQPGAHVAFGIDATPERTLAAIGVASIRADGLEHVEVVAQGNGLGWVVARAKELHERHRGVVWVIDPAGPAGALAGDLAAAGLPLLEVTGRDWGRACASLYDAVVQGRLRHLGDPVLDGAVAVARRREIGDGGFAWARRSSLASIAPLVAVTLARWGAVTERPQPAISPLAVRNDGFSQTADLMHIGF